MTMPVNSIHTISCPLESKYKFVTKCAIGTCMYHTTETSNRCLLLVSRNNDMMLDNHRISDKDLLRWKGGMLRTSNLNEVRNLRQTACHNVHAIIILDRYLRYLEDKRPPCTISRKQRLLVAYQLLSEREPFTNSDLLFQPWMAIYMFSEDVYDAFCNSMQNKVYRSLSKADKPEKETKAKRPPSNRIKAMDFKLNDLCFVPRAMWEADRDRILQCEVDLFSMLQPSIDEHVHVRTAHTP